MYTVYILYSDTLKKYYTGHTINLELRMKERNSGESKFTKSGMPWQLEHIINTSSRANAMKLEKTIKKQGAKRYIERNNIKSEELSRHAIGVKVVSSNLAAPTNKIRYFTVTDFSFLGNSNAIDSY